MKMENNGKKSINNFEEALQRLDEIVGLLEKGDAPLDESLALYEEGVGLVRFCNEKLKSARQKVTEITSSGTE